MRSQDEESQLSVGSCNVGSKRIDRGCESEGEHTIHTHDPFDVPATSSHVLAAPLATLPPHVTV